MDRHQELFEGIVPLLNDGEDVVVLLVNVDSGHIVAASTLSHKMTISTLTLARGALEDVDPSLIDSLGRPDVTH
jgi:hypothetical protein